ncbi:hypothetical protein K438DRAFT_1751982 [Mycena galopus ATCC 62051]|nr:hypothetical protein K438DRAFT_1751982 [Mycena galopus ATCC 62051]
MHLTAKSAIKVLLKRRERCLNDKYERVTSNKESTGTRLRLETDTVPKPRVSTPKEEDELVAEMVLKYNTNVGYQCWKTSADSGMVQLANYSSNASEEAHNLNNKGLDKQAFAFLFLADHVGRQREDGEGKVGQNIQSVEGQNSTPQLTGPTGVVAMREQGQYQGGHAKWKKNQRGTGKEDGGWKHSS